MTWLKLIGVQRLLGAVLLATVLSYFFLPAFLGSLIGILVGLLISGFTLNYYLLRGDEDLTYSEIKIPSPPPIVRELFNGHELGRNILKDLQRSTQTLMLNDMNNLDKGKAFPLSYEYKMQCKKCSYQFRLKISHYGWSENDSNMCWVLSDGLVTPENPLTGRLVAMDCAESRDRVMDGVLE